jgi:hypothetical protein
MTDLGKIFVIGLTSFVIALLIIFSMAVAFAKVPQGRPQEYPGGEGLL